MTNSYEQRLGTSPRLADSDGDQLNDSYELELGTNATDVDTDGDNLYDTYEVRAQQGTDPHASLFPDANPLHKDLYVVYSVHDGGEMLTDRERTAVVEAFAEMPVENPDGTTGIRVHDSLRPAPNGQLDRTLVVGSFEEWVEIGRADWRADILGNRSRYYHHVVIVNHVDGTDVGGRAQSPGRYATIEGEHQGDLRGQPLRSVYTIHELLHNIVGQPEALGGDGHTEEGWLKHEYDETEPYLSEAVATYLSEEGFTP